VTVGEEAEAAAAAEDGSAGVGDGHRRTGEASSGEDSHGSEDDGDQSSEVDGGQGSSADEGQGSSAEDTCPGGALQ
jgi:hypothetical protein